MGDVLGGTLALIVLYAVLQPNAGKAATVGSSWFISGLRRLTAADVAGVRQVKTAKAQVQVPNLKPNAGPPAVANGTWI